MPVPVKRNLKCKRIFIAEGNCKKKLNGKMQSGELLKKVASWLSKNRSQKLCSFLSTEERILKALRQKHWEAAPKPPSKEASPGKKVLRSLKILEDPWKSWPGSLKILMKILTKVLKKILENPGRSLKDFHQVYQC